MESTVDVVFAAAELGKLLDLLRSDGYDVIGPTVRSGAIVAAPITSVSDLPQGRGDFQRAGHYRLTDRGDELYFAFAATALSWKPYLFPARRLLWRADDEGAPRAPEVAPPRQALIGVRSCDLHAIAVQDRVFADRHFVDPDYVARREALFVVAVTCAVPGGTCFCTSMDTGPRATSGFDLGLTELADEDGHRFLAQAGSEAGARMLARLETATAQAEHLAAADRITEGAVANMGLVVDVTDLRDLLRDNAEHPRWDVVAGRCLSCTNCTLVCPTCFCATAEDVSDLAGTVGRDLVWDSCFSAGHSYLHGGPVRSTVRTRYRQWLTHKFSSWIDQFGTSGCVGCGRCITSCPAAIDVTEELAAIRAEPVSDERVKR